MHLILQIRHFTAVLYLVNPFRGILEFGISYFGIFYLLNFNLIPFTESFTTPFS